MKAKDIITLVEDIKRQWRTNDPYKIAKRLGIEVMHRDVTLKDFTAQIIKSENYPTIISINNAYTDLSKKILCAHELGHAILHEGCVNNFAVTSKNVASTVEYEANLFALALLAGSNLEYKMVMPLTEMSNYLLKSIIEHNLKKD